MATTKASISEHARRLGLHAKTLWRAMRTAGVRGRRKGQTIFLSQQQADFAASFLNSRPGRPKK